MTERPQVNIRMEKELLAEIDELAQAEHVDRTEIARRLLNSGLSAYRMERSLTEYKRGNVSAWKAASLAGVSLYEMLDRVHEAGIPYEVDPDVLQRLDRGPAPAAVREAPSDYGRVAPDAESGIAELREQFKPERVRILFVGESSPAGGNHFYRANSNLFRATQAAFAQAFGEEEVPDGPRFLHWFRDHGCWLVDLADLGGVEALVQLIRDDKPEQIITVKASIGSAVQQAASTAGFAGPVVELPFPVRQWRAVYVRRLAGVLVEPGYGFATGTP